MRKKFLFLLVSAQIAIIFSLGILVYFKLNNDVLGISVTPLSSKNLNFNKESDLKYFYENVERQALNVVLPWSDGETVRQVMNKDGFNQLYDYTVEKPDNVFRIATIGDSFTFGEYVDTQDNYPSKLQEKLNNECMNEFQVLNLGVGGYDIQYTVERFKLRGEKYKPDLVLWLFIDDIFRLSEETRPRWEVYRNQMMESGEIESVPIERRVSAGWKKAQDEVLSVFGEEKILSMQREYFAELNNYYEGKLIILTFPSIFDRSTNFFKSLADNRENTMFYNSLPNVFTMNDAHLPDTHPNSYGYELISEDIFEQLISNNLIECN